MLQRAQAHVPHTRGGKDRGAIGSPARRCRRSWRFVAAGVTALVVLSGACSDHAPTVEQADSSRPPASASSAAPTVAPRQVERFCPRFVAAKPALEDAATLSASADLRTVLAAARLSLRDLARVTPPPATRDIGTLTHAIDLLNRTLSAYDYNVERARAEATGQQAAALDDHAATDALQRVSAFVAQACPTDTTSSSG